LDHLLLLLLLELRRLQGRAMASPPRPPDDATILALMAEMDQLRLLQQQQSWELQAKLGVLSGSELDALKRPQMKSSLMAAHNKWVTKPAELNATYISRKPLHRPPARSALLLTPLDQLDLLAAPSEHGTCSSPSEIEDDESLPDDDESDYDSITSPRSPGESALAAAATASTAPPPGAHEASKSLGGTKGDGFIHILGHGLEAELALQTFGECWYSGRSASEEDAGQVGWT
jgi:hypothetical protein